MLDKRVLTVRHLGLYWEAMDSLFENVVEQLKSAPLGTAGKIAQAKKLHKDTILRIRRREITNPRVQTLEAISAYFREQA